MVSGATTNEPSHHGDIGLITISETKKKLNMRFESDLMHIESLLPI